jgi:hypothetical protein
MSTSIVDWEERGTAAAKTLLDRCWTHLTIWRVRAIVARILAAVDPRQPETFDTKAMPSAHADSGRIACYLRDAWTEAGIEPYALTPNEFRWALLDGLGLKEPPAPAWVKPGVHVYNEMERRWRKIVGLMAFGRGVQLDEIGSDWISMGPFLGAYGPQVETTSVGRLEKTRIDGVTLQQGDMVLFENQADPESNTVHRMGYVGAGEKPKGSKTFVAKRKVAQGAIVGANDVASAYGLTRRHLDDLVEHCSGEISKAILGPLAFDNGASPQESIRAYVDLEVLDPAEHAAVAAVLERGVMSVRDVQTVLSVLRTRQQFLDRGFSPKRASEDAIPRGGMPGAFIRDGGASPIFEAYDRARQRGRPWATR